jgi:chromosome segregation ATPase
MRKAFDDNVSRSKPRLRLGAFTATVEQPAEASAQPAHAGPVAGAPVHPIEETIAQIAATVAHLPPPEPVVEVTRPATPAPSPKAQITEALQAKAIAPEQLSLDPKARRERLKERLKAATAPVSPSQPTPSTPAEARSSALSLIAELRAQLEDAGKLNAALSKDLEQARGELARAAEEAKSRTAEANRMVSEVAERSKLIDELKGEMESLEAERDDALVELRNARAAVDQLQKARAELDQKLSAREAELADTLSEEERLAGELEGKVAELRKSENALQALTAERDALSKQVTELTRERTALTESQRALDEIHRALAEARSRVGR